MTGIAFSDVVLPLPRPEYVAAPELLISSLAWRLYDVRGLDSGALPTALSFRSEPRSSNSLDLRATSPQSSGEWAAWEDALDGAGLECPDAPAALTAQGLAFAISGIRAKKAKGQAATPLTPSLALLQNARGMMGKRNPPNIGLILECLYALGTHNAEHSAAGHWRGAVEYRMRLDPFLAALDRAVAQGLLPGAIDPATVEEVPKPVALGAATPFAWFADMWDRLTSREWVEALPARRWVDWATLVLRLGMAMGYLWEARWYERLARLAVAGPDAAEAETFESIVASLGPLVPWADAGESVSVRDVAPQLKSSLRRGAHLRPILSTWGEAHPGITLVDGLKAMAEDDELVSQLQYSLSTSDNAGANTWEAVRYALLTRERSGPYADHYGMLATRGRYLLIEPATEWVAVMASLAEGGPGATTTIGAVRRELARLGLRPSLAELTRLLEASGLARGSADADQSVVVQSAY